jgi:hypothetical protein
MAPRGDPRGAFVSRPSRIHPTLFEVQLALQITQHDVVDLALGTQLEQCFALRVDHRSPDLAVLDELPVLFIAVGGRALALDVLGAVLVGPAELIEQWVVAGPDGV